MMLKAFHNASRDMSTDGRQGGWFGYFEAWKHTDSSGKSIYTDQAAPLGETELEDWACMRGRFSRPPVEEPLHVQGGVRLLFAQSKDLYGRAVPAESLMSGVLVEALQLPESTLTSFHHPSGLHSCHTYPEGSTLDSCSRLGFVFRSPQKWECSIGGLSICHDFETCVTTGLSVGFAFNIDQFKTADQQPPAVEKLIASMRECAHMLCHPTLLPCLFLAMHVQRVRAYVLGSLSDHVMEIEAIIGVTKAGRSQRRYINPHSSLPAPADGQKLFVGVNMQRERARLLVGSINDISTYIIFAKRSPQWDIESIDWLLQVLRSNERLQSYHGVEREVFCETLNYLRSYSEACLEITQTSEARMQLQLNILYTSIAQDDGQTSARLAISAGKDSTSMKIIALITAAYLPGTFVATLFSMGMFDWTTSSGDESLVYSSFWIYWAVTIPMTVITLAGWAIWWKFEKYRFERDIKLGFQEAGDPVPFPPRMMNKVGSIWT